jgi:hypothetical protein
MRYIAFTLLLALMVGCVQRPRYMWTHSSGSFNQSQFQIDDGSCTSSAYAAIGPMPQQPQGSTTTFSGTTSQGGTFQGRATTTPTGQLWGAAAGNQAFEAEQRYRNAISSAHRGCMAQRGWSLSSM